MAVGLTIELILMAFSHQPILVGIENQAADLSMRLEASLFAGAPPPIRIGRIDIDEETWRDHRWGGGEPYYAPRGRLGELLRFAAAQNPRFVVLDVFAEDPSTPDDGDLLNTLKGLPPNIDYILVRSVQQPLLSESDEGEQLLSAKIQHSALDPFIKSHPNFHIAAPYFLTSRDGIVRGWHLWMAGCRTQDDSQLGYIEVVPSVQLIVSALYKPQDARPNREALERQALEHALEAKSRCATDIAALPSSSAAREMAERTSDALKRIVGDIARKHLVRGLNDDLERVSESRILYRYSPEPGLAQVASLSALSVLDGGDSHGASRTALQEFGRKVQGGVVVIGQSFAGAGDTHATPLGAEPGSAIILNAITSILKPGLIREPPPLLDGAFVVAIIIAVAWIFACAKSVFANLVSVTGVLVLVVPTSLLLLQFGYWLNFAAPLIGIALHRAFAELRDDILPRRANAHVHSTSHREEH